MIALGRRGDVFLGGRLAGQQLDRAVVVRRHLVVQRANQRHAMAQLGLQRKDLANVQPGHGGRDRTQRPAIFAGCVGLAVVGFELARAAPHPEQDDRRVGCRCLRRGPGCKQVRQPQTAQGQRAHAQKLASPHRSSTGEGGHGARPSGIFGGCWPAVTPTRLRTNVPKLMGKAKPRRTNVRLSPVDWRRSADDIRRQSGYTSAPEASTTTSGQPGTRIWRPRMNSQPATAIRLGRG